MVVYNPHYASLYFSIEICEEKGDKLSPFV